MIRVWQVTKAYGPCKVLDGISFTVAAGRCLALWGGNGAGKSTTLKCILGLVSYSGTVEVAGRDVQSAQAAVRRLVGYVPQDLPRWDSAVGEVVRLVAELKGVPLIQAHGILARLGLAACGRQAVQSLSGGMRQRLALALALLGNPPVLLLDEPTANLDEQARQELLALLGGLKRAGKAILFASHRAEEVQALADEVAMLAGGRLAALLPAAEFLRSAAGRGAACAGIQRRGQG